MTAEMPDQATTAGTLDDGYDPTGRTSAEIERDIGRTRADLSLLIAALERKFTPRHLLDQGIDMLQDTMTVRGGRIGGALRGNPLPLALIGAGLGWMAINGAAGKHTAEAAEQPAPAGGSSDAPDGPAADYSYARVKSDPRGAADEAAGPANDGKQGLMARVARTASANPLALGALGLFAGAALALLLPASRTEEKLLRPVRKQLREQAQAVSLEAADRARRAAGQAIDAATGAVVQAARGEPVGIPRPDDPDIVL
jgi:Protein of unknown function (DUF3618)